MAKETEEQRKAREEAERIKAFQASKGLKVTGVLDTATKAMMAEPSKDPKPAPDMDVVDPKNMANLVKSIPKEERVTPEPVHKGKAPSAEQFKAAHGLKTEADVTKKKTELGITSPGERPTGEGVKPVSSFQSSVRRGDAGEDVKKVQKALWDDSPKAVPDWGVDGLFGPETEQAVKSFQKRHKIKPTGVVTSSTLRKMDELEKVRQKGLQRSPGTIESGEVSRPETPKVEANPTNPTQTKTVTKPPAAIDTRRMINTARGPVRNPDYGKPVAGSDENPSTAQRILDVLARGAYAVGSAITEESAQQATQDAESKAKGVPTPDDPLERLQAGIQSVTGKDWGKIGGAAVEGLEGQSKIMPSQALIDDPNAPETGFKELAETGKAGEFISRFAADIGGDPLTFVSGKPILSAGSAVKNAIKGAPEAAVVAKDAAKSKVLDDASDLLAAGKVKAAKKVFEAGGYTKETTDRLIKQGKKSVKEQTTKAATPAMPEVPGTTTPGAKVSATGLPKLPQDLVSEAATKPVSPSKVIKDRAVSNVYDNVVKAINDTRALSPQTTKETLDNVLAESKAAMRAAGVNPKTINESLKRAKDVIRESATTPQRVLEQNAGLLAKASTKGWSPDTEVVRAALTRALEKHVGPTREITPEDVMKGWDPVKRMTYRFAAHTGQEDLYDEALGSYASAHARSARIGEAVSKTLKGVKDNDVPTIMRYAAGKVDRDLVNPKYLKQADSIREFLQTYLASSGIKDLNRKGANSVSSRIGAGMQEINDALRMRGIDSKHFLRNTDSKGNAKDWMTSWEDSFLDVKTTKEAENLLNAYAQAVEDVAAKAAYFDEVATQFGKLKPTATHTTQIKGAPRLSGVYFPKEIADQISIMANRYGEHFSPKSKFVNGYSKFLSLWKKYVTIPMPSHHIRNILGDTYMNWTVAGINSPKPYYDALRVMKANFHKYDKLQDAQKFTARQPMQNMANSKPTSIAVRTKGGRKITNEEAYQLMYRAGILQRAHITEDIFGDTKIAFKPLAGQGERAILAMSQFSNDFPRIAQALHILSKSKGTTDDALIKELHEVRRVHPDALNLTKEEQKMRYLIPFYSWTRKAVPLVIEGLVNKPGKATVYPKAMYNLQQTFGGEPTSFSEQFPTTEMVPDFVKSGGIGPVPPGIAEAMGVPKGKGLYADPGNPLLDLVRDFFPQVSPSPVTGKEPTSLVPGSVKSIAEMISPALKVPIEAVSGRTDLGAGQAIKEREGGVPRYLAEQIPVVAPISRALSAKEWSETGGLF